MKLLNDLYQTGGPSLTHSFDAASYLISTEKGLYMIECGTPDGYQDCLRNIRSLGYDAKDIRAVFGTHGHYDHVGAAAMFKRDFGSKLYLHRGDQSQVEIGDSTLTTAGLLYGKDFPPCQVDEILDDCAVFDLGTARMEVMHTPGHTPGSVCFILHVDDLTVLIAGDTIHGGFSPLIGSSEDSWRKSLDKICARHYDLMVFGHSAPYLLADADTRLREARASFANYYNPWFKNFKDSYRY